jgi:hypothetical protein
VIFRLVKAFFKRNPKNKSGSTELAQLALFGRCCRCRRVGAVDVLALLHVGAVSAVGAVGAVAATYTKNRWKMKCLEAISFEKSFIAALKKWFSTFDSE